MQPEETYRYLEIPQKQQVDHNFLKKIFTEKDRKSHKKFWTPSYLWKTRWQHSIRGQVIY